MRYLIASVCVVILFTACEESTTGPSVITDERLVGTWIGEEVGGSSGWTGTFTETALTNESPSGNENYTATYTIYDTDPRRMDCLITDCNYPEYIGKTAHAIYKIVGDTLVMAGNEPGNASIPSAFTSSGNTRLYKLVKQ